MFDYLYESHNFADLEAHFGITFEDKDLLVQAFVHPSYTNYRKLNHYERLEFLGDSIVSIVVSDYIFRNFPEMSEGEMTRRRALLVSENAFAYLVRRNTMINYLILGKSVTNDTDKLSNSYVADVFESLVAAIYLDQGFEAAEKFIYRNHLSYMDEILEQDFSNDFKSRIQEILQVNGPITLNYESEPHKDGFKSTLYFDGVLIGSGIGRTKKSAEQQAAKQAISIMVENDS